jgi:hypothetical protein
MKNTDALFQLSHVVYAQEQMFKQLTSVREMVAWASRVVTHVAYLFVSSVIVFSMKSVKQSFGVELNEPSHSVYRYLKTQEIEKHV